VTLAANPTSQVFSGRRSAALEFLCSCLSSSNGQELEDRIGAAGEAPHFRWSDFIELATDHMVAPTLAYRFDRCGLGESLPDLVERYFGASLRLNRGRNAKLRGQATEVAAALNEIDVTPVFLKGAAGLLSGLYEEPGIRMMSDLDILVPADRGGDCVARLTALGYVPAKSEDHPRMHTFASLAGPSGRAPVDLHREALAYPYELLLPVGDVVGQAISHDFDGGKLAVPSPTHQVIHSIGHAQLSDHAYAYGRLPLQSLHDVMLLRQKWGSSIDWRRIDSCFCTNGNRTALGYHWLAARELLNQTPETGVRPNTWQRALLRRARFMVDHPVLQRISDRFVRVLLLLRRELADTELRARLGRNMRRRDWWQRHLAIFWQGGR